MLWWGDGAGWGGLVVMILAMAGFWALVVVATMAIFHGVRDDPADRRRRSGAESDLSQELDMRLAIEKPHEHGPTLMPSSEASGTDPTVRNDRRRVPRRTDFQGRDLPFSHEGNVRVGTHFVPHHATPQPDLQQTFIENPLKPS